jgi:broad specificity polyphosphatase/5'/3'-nucleotidase SurE
MFIEGFRTDSLYVPGTNIRISQLVGLLCFIGCGAALLVLTILTRKREPLLVIEDAAYEAANLGLRAISVSTDPSYYPQATMHMDRVYQFLIKHDLSDPNVIYNVNIPPEAGPIRITRQGGVYYTDEFIPQGGNLYLPTGRCAHEDTGNLQLDTDATIHGCISISPLSLERTNLDLFYDLQKINEQ